MKIISGGQTGVDRTALEVAIELDLPHSGWCPKGRRAEDGVIPAKFQLQETSSRNYAIRTRKNIEDSDGTLVFHLGTISGGTALTCRTAKTNGKPLQIIDLSDFDAKDQAMVEEVGAWIKCHKILVLNVAGPRLSSSPKLPFVVRTFLNLLLAAFFKKQSFPQQGKK